MIKRLRIKNFQSHKDTELEKGKAVGFDELSDPVFPETLTGTANANVKIITAWMVETDENCLAEDKEG
jgi:AAA15 family ATPase/GTPase